MYVEGGQSAIVDALYLSVEKISEQQKKDNNRRTALILISDGEERDSYYSIDEMLSLIAKTDIQIFTIALTKNLTDKKSNGVKNAKTNAEKFVRTLALETGGISYISGEQYTNDDLANALKSIFQEIRSQYIISYTSTNQKRDGLPRKLRIEVADNEKGEKRQGIIRESFIVPKN